MHALIIEAQALISMLLEEELRELGFTSFDTATTQDAAITAAKRRCPDLITACVHLTDGSGDEAVRIICEQQSIPTVYIVGNPDEIEAGSRDKIVVVKPFTREGVRTAVERATQTKRASQTA